MTRRASKIITAFQAIIWIILNVKSPWAFLKAYYLYRWQTIHLGKSLMIKARGPQALKYLYAVFGKRIYGTFHGTEKVVVDIGANIGLYSMYSALHTNNTCSIFAFEPSPGTYKVLEENIRRNKLHGKIIPIAKAVAGSKSVLQMALPDNPLCHNLYNFKNSPIKVEVQTTHLQEIIEKRGIDFIDVLKLNCEGAEYDILLNLPDAVLDKIGEIRMEYHKTIVNGKRVEVQQIIDYLCGKGYKISKLLPVHPRHGIIWFSRA